MSAEVDRFLRSVLKSELLPREPLQEALRDLPKVGRDDPKTVADHLVAKNLLTPYQAHKLLLGVSLGLVLGNYRIQAPIGRGGMGTVYLAKDSRTLQPAAIKVLSSKRAREGERHLQRFQREMDLSQRLRHPNVARTLEVGVEHGVHYIALEYIPGQTLSRLVHSQGLLSAARAARLFAEVAAALEHAHAQGIIHRDVKPSNIMVTPDDRIKLLDVGLALLVGEEVEDTEVVGGKGYVVGSLDYIAPEQTRDPTQIDARADLYALGGALYFALTGKPPAVGTNSKEKIHAHRHLEPEPIQRRNPQVPDPFARYVHRLLSKNPDHRPSSATEVRQAMLAWADKAPVRLPEPDLGVYEAKAWQPESSAGDTLGEVFQAKADPGEPWEPFDAFDQEQWRRDRILWWSVVGASSAAALVLVISILVLIFKR